jgi:hypothetical protein
VLHNYLRNNEILEGNVDGDMEEMPGNQLLPWTHTNNRSASTAFFVRQNFTRYFNRLEVFLGKRTAFQKGSTKHL